MQENGICGDITACASDISERIDGLLIQSHESDMHVQKCTKNAQINNVKIKNIQQQCEILKCKLDTAKEMNDCEQKQKKTVMTIVKNNSDDTDIAQQECEANLSNHLQNIDSIKIQFENNMYESENNKDKFNNELHELNSEILTIEWKTLRRFLSVIFGCSLCDNNRYFRVINDNKSENDRYYISDSLYSFKYSSFDRNYAAVLLDSNGIDYIHDKVAAGTYSKTIDDNISLITTNEAAIFAPASITRINNLDTVAECYAGAELILCDDSYDLSCLTNGTSCINIFQQVTVIF